MTTINIQLTHACSGGNHFTFAITGDKAATLPLTRDEITQPITSDDVAAFMRVICKMARTGRINAQAKTLLEAGVTVAV